MGTNKLSRLLFFMKIFLWKKQKFFGKTKLLWGKKLLGKKKKILEIIFETKNWAGKKLLKKKMLVKKQKKFLARKKNSG